jgi:hypothetical protein
MDALVLALAPAFVCGFAIQRLLELVDPAVDRFFPGTGEKKARWKKGILGIVAIIGGLIFAAVGIRVLDPISEHPLPDWIDFVATGLVVSAGTEGLNSIMKFLGYKKEEQKVETKGLQDTAGSSLDTRTMSQTG